MLSIIKTPSTTKKLEILTQAAQYDVCLTGCSLNPTGKKGRTPDPVSPLEKWIYPCHMPGGGKVSILKVLQTNACNRHCKYCALSADHDEIPRMGFSSEELAKLFMELVKKREVHGIFISSGTGVNSENAMEKMIHTTKLLRDFYHFNGYIHLKLLPGISFGLIEAATRYANRISINLESPKRELLKDIAPDKHFINDLITPMRRAGQIIQNGSFAKSQTTQFIVGASNENDLDIMKAVDWVYRELYTYRAYFSSLQTLPNNTKVSNSTHNNILREHRLYQSDYLLRGYGFRLKDLVFDSNGNIPEEFDPKTAYAIMHPELYPVDINSASENLLLKVPGIGPASARKIVAERKKNAFRNLKDLKAVGAIVSSASSYIEFSGKNPGRNNYSKATYIKESLFDDYIKKGWKTSQTAYQEEKIKFDEKSYDYPGQKNKPLQIACDGKQKIYCR